MSRRWRCARVLPSSLLLALILILDASPVPALYLFLDSNGDGTRTAADVVSPHDTTRVTVWLMTDQYKPGTSDDCSHGSREGEHSYSIVFHATGGTVAWGQFVPDPPAHGAPFSSESDDSTYLKVKGRIPNWDTTNKIRLGTFTALVLRGRPSIEIASQRPMQPYEETRISTGTWDGPFSKCADGLAYGGQANRPPLLTRLGDYSIRAGASERLVIQAGDLDKDPLTFRLKRGPSFVSVSTLDSGHGMAQGAIWLAPDSCARGPAECVVEVDDGFATDVDTMVITVRPIVRPLPTSPMQAPIWSGDRAVPQGRSPVDSTWLTGEWEWHETVSSWGGWDPRWPGPYDGPAQRGYRRRIVFRRDGKVEMFEIAHDRVRLAQEGTYRLEGTRLTVTNWIEPFYTKSGAVAFNTWKAGPSSFSIYPWGMLDASSETFVRAPAVLRDGTPIDTGRVIAPIDTPSVRLEGSRVHVTLPEPMKAALHKCDPAFRMWDEADSRELDPHADKGRSVRGPSAVVGDFDGDLLPDVALLGRSGADQVVIAILSDHGNIRASEVTWRRVRAGQGENKSRGDPREIPQIYLELAPRGSANPFCWMRRWDANPIDGIGIVEPGVARFDYLLAGDRFVLFAPLP